MKKGKYTSRRIKDYLWKNAAVFSGTIFAVIFVMLAERRELKALALTVMAIAWGVHLAEYYYGIYLPNKKLEKMVADYKDSEELELREPLSENDDLISELQQILSSLDTIAIRQKNAEILTKNAEINNLQDQINPHFLYNTLEVIRGEALINGDRRIAEMTASLANHFRYNISRTESFVYLKDELKNSMNYFNIQKSRFGDKIFCEVVYHGIEAADVADCYIPKLILQPIIENAIYHGLELKMGKGTIRIHITVADNDLKITVSDDGMGMPKEKLDEINSDYSRRSEDKKRHNGVAVRNIKKRLKLYWGDRAYMEAASEEGVGTQIYLSMPLLYEKEEYMK